MPNSVLTELHLINNNFYPKATKILTDGLMKSQCKLEALGLVLYSFFVVSTNLSHLVKISKNRNDPNYSTIQENIAPVLLYDQFFSPCL